MAFPISVRLEWSFDHDSADPQIHGLGVEAIEHLEVMLDGLERAATERAIIVELVSSSGARLGLGIGRSDSVLSFKASDEPPYFVSFGKHSSGVEDVGFYFQGRWTEFAGWSLVPLEQARQAARHFVATGQRPENVKWQEV